MNDITIDNAFRQVVTEIQKQQQNANNFINKMKEQYHERYNKRHVNTSLRETVTSLGLPTTNLNTVFKATVVAKLSEASPSWWDFNSTHDRNWLEALLRLGYHDVSDQTFTDICEQSDETLFNRVKETPIIFCTCYSLQNAVNIICCKSILITFTFLCQPLLKMTITL